MNVTKANFRKTLPLVEECLKRSTFIALDMEMTGMDKDIKLLNMKVPQVGY